MFDFLIRNSVVKSAQKFINRLNPKVNVIVPRDLPLPSIFEIKKMSVAVAKINALEPQMSALTDEQLKAKTAEFRERIQGDIREFTTDYRRIYDLRKNSTSNEEREQLSIELEQVKDTLKIKRQEALDKVLPEAFAVVREMGRRKLGMRHFDVQLIGGMVLHGGKISEMATGEGKTLVATLAAYLNALPGDGVHVVTVNDYLAKRDREWMGPIYEALGLSVGVIVHDLDPRQRQQAYAADITYGTNNEFGFDYLRDNMVNFREEMVQRKHFYAIVDEVDSILIDEARTPLIISGPAEESTGTYYKAFEISRTLKGRRTTENEESDAKHKEIDLGKGFDYIAEEKARSINLTEQGEEKAARQFGVDNLHEMETIEYRHHILQALKAKEFFKCDVDYVVREGKVIIVDEFTGRLMPGRRWSDGLHQAVEAKEGIKIERESQTFATITFQNYFRMYDKLAGMTGTAYTEANEFKQIYNLDCAVIPTNRVLSRQNHSDAIYKTAREKYKAVVEEIAELHKNGQPVLVGTISIEKSELLSDLLKKRGIPHQVLNAKYHDLEAQIIAQAGRYKAVTIATNMAGRGTDIVLGGNAEYLAKSLAEQTAKENKEGAPAENLVGKFLEQFKVQVKEEHQKVVGLGGLFVLGTERHESRRIDNQLRGRSGRQGDPGASRFYLSMEDDLMRLFGSDRVAKLMDKIGMEEDQVIEHPMVTGTIEMAQKRVETHYFEARKQLIEYDNVMNLQREAIYNLRRSVLETENVKDRILEAISEAGAILTEQYLYTQVEGEIPWDLAGLDTYLKTNFKIDLGSQKDEFGNMDKEQVIEVVAQALLKAYENKEREFSPEAIRRMERLFLLHTIDARWKDHLYAMDQLKEGVGLRALGQRDPLIEYKREGFQMFQMMFASINQEIVEVLFKLQPVERQQEFKGVFSSLPQQFVHKEIPVMSRENVAPVSPESDPGRQRPSAPAAQPVHNAGPKIGRNDPCSCGSGLKYKKCCGK